MNLTSKIHIRYKDQSSQMCQLSPLQSMCNNYNNWFPWAGTANSYDVNLVQILTTKLFLYVSNIVPIFLRSFRSNFQLGSPIFFPNPILSQHINFVEVMNICSRLNYLFKMPSLRQTIKVDSIFQFVIISCPLTYCFSRTPSLSNMNFPLTMVPKSLIMRFSVSAMSVVLEYSIFNETFSPSSIQLLGQIEIFLIQEVGMLKLVFSVLLTDCSLAVLILVGSLIVSNLCCQRPRYCDFFHMMYQLAPH